MRKFLFLDIDGVLNSQESCRKLGGYGYPPAEGDLIDKDRLKWDESMVARLRRIVEETGCQIVISSSWRGYGEYAITAWQAMFAVYGWDNAPVIGETPRSTFGNVSRGSEVNEWLDSNLGSEVFQFVIIDDDPDFEPWHPLVQTSTEHGLQDEHVARCISMLKDGMLTSLGG